MRRGYIADMDATEGAIREAMEQAERIARTQVEDGYLLVCARSRQDTAA